MMVMKGSIRIGQVRGIPLRTHWSVPLLVVLFALASIHRCGFDVTF
ncbi:hypothetical protein [Streptomyces scopuliridis]